MLYFQICKHFLEAVEKSKYGWFWECPSGTKCIYRHALPPGFVLKRDKKKMEEKKNEISLVDLIERERAALGANQTKITLETFLAWKKKKIKEKQVCNTYKYNLFTQGNEVFYIFFSWFKVDCGEQSVLLVY